MINRQQVIAVSIGLIIFLGFQLAATASSPATKTTSPQAFSELHRKDLRVTAGSVKQTQSGFLTVTEASVRAVANHGTARGARLRFRYRGPSDNTAPLASGAVRRQIGLKLRAKNGCNLLYVMWRIEPEERLVVSVKKNPGQKTHRECGARGYVDITPTESRSLPATAKDNETHRLRAELLPFEGGTYPLVVYVDSVLVWRGGIAAFTLRGIDGPAGLRTDNGSFIFRFFTLDPQRRRARR